MENSAAMDDGTEDIKLFSAQPKKKQKTAIVKKDDKPKQAAAIVQQPLATVGPAEEEEKTEAQLRTENEASTDPSNQLNIETFKELGLSDWLCGVCKSLGMARPTQVQQGCIPAILEGRDVIGLAQTGSGKTAAFALPILQKLAQDPFGVFALALTPTRSACMVAPHGMQSLRMRLLVCILN